MRRLLAGIIATVVLAAGCSSSGDGAAPSTSASASTSAVASGLMTKIEHGTSALTSAHLDVDAGALGGTISGDVALADGRTTGSDLTIHQAGNTVEVVTVHGTSYAKLPSGQSTSGKPWVTVSSSSSNEFVRGLAGTLALTNAATSLGSLTGVLSTAATGVRSAGAASVNGVDTVHYRLTLDPGKVTGDLGSALGAVGAKSLPVDLWIDAKGRPVQVRIAVPLGGQTLPLTIKVSRFDAPVQISTPPASEVSGG